MLPPSTPDLASLDLFLTVVQLGSLSRAAAAHGLAQPSVSARMRQLERQLGVVLLTRGPTGTVPTTEGRAVARWAEAVVDAAHDLTRGVRALQPRGGGRMQVAASYTIAEYLVPGWLDRLRTQAGAPDEGTVVVELEVVNSTGVLERVHKGSVALGFIESPGPIGGVRSRQIGDDELVVVVGRDHPWVRRRRPLPAAHLVATRLLLREPTSGTREVFEEAVRLAGLAAPLIALELGSTSALKAAAAGGTAPAQEVSA